MSNRTPTAMNQNASAYAYTVEPFTEDCFGHLSWGRLGNLILRCASMHAGQHGFGFEDMKRMGHAWVLSRLAIEMERPLPTGAHFEIETWVDRIYRQFTDRHFTVRLADGTVCGHATSTWSLIDFQSRQPADLTQLANGGFTHTLIPERPAPIAPVGRIRLVHASHTATHRAAYTDLDINCHFNSPPPGPSRAPHRDGLQPRGLRGRRTRNLARRRPEEPAPHALRNPQAGQGRGGEGQRGDITPCYQPSKSCAK